MVRNPEASGGRQKTYKRRWVFCLGLAFRMTILEGKKKISRKQGMEFLVIKEKSRDPSTRPKEKKDISRFASQFRGRPGIEIKRTKKGCVKKI